MYGPRGACDDDDCCDEIALAFVRCMRDVCAPAARLCEQLEPVQLFPVSGFTRVYRHLYPAYRAMYDDEGAPLGPDDDDMWRWHEERFSTLVN
jgi:hypothetical protein